MEIKGLLKAVNLAKNKFDATTAPTVNNDVTEGYSPGSQWADVTNDEFYICVDATEGAAVWVEITQARGIAGKITWVTTVAELEAAIAAQVADEVILIAPGEYILTASQSILVAANGGGGGIELILR